MTSPQQRQQTFRALHESGCFVLPNAWDVGSARLLAHAGFGAIATTSAGYAAALGKHDESVTLDELVTHVRALASALDVPLHVDAERCYADDPAGVADVVEAIASAGAQGVSIEDYDPRTGGFDPIDVAAERVAAAADAARRHGLLLTARADHGFHVEADEQVADEVIERLTRYREAGAGCLYAPGVNAPDHVSRIVGLGLPVNVLMDPAGPDVATLRTLGVRRVSTGGKLAWTAYGALMTAARELREHGTLTAPLLSTDDRRAFDRDS